MLAAGALNALPTACARQRPALSGSELTRVERWWIVIGASHFLESADWRHHSRDTQMVVLSGDSPVRWPAAAGHHPTRLSERR